VRLKLGRPDLQNYARYFDVPAAAPDFPLSVTWAGVTTLLIDDGASALMTDGFFSRPGLASVGLRRISPSPPRIDGCLARLGVDRLEAVLPVHTHYDHAMDSAVVAERTGARVVGGTSAAQVGRGRGLSEDRLVVGSSGEPITQVALGQLGLLPEGYLVDYWAETVRAVGAGRVVLIHWDDFFRPLHKPLRALPYAVDDLDVSMRVLARLADEDSIALHLPTLWQRADPWISVS